MLSLSDYAASVRDVCLEDEPDAERVRALGGDEWRWLRYRRMVRKRLGDTIRHAFPRLEAALGEGAFAALESGFFAARALASPFIRDVPGELLGWLEQSAAEGRVTLPDWALELGRLEWAERQVSYAEDDPPGDLAELAMHLPVVLTLAHRLIAAEHAVHRAEPTNNRQPERRFTWLCVYREPGTHAVRVLETTAVTHALLGELARGASLFESISLAAERQRAAIDERFMTALAELLADLTERGVVRGARAAP
jgi:hypothetical protein